MVLRQNKGDNSFPCQGARTCDIVCFCYITKTKECENTMIAKDNDNYAFVMRNKVQSRSG